MASSVAHVSSVPAAASDTALFEQVVAYHEKKIAANPIYGFLLSNVEWTHASHGLVVARLKLEPCHMNSGGSLHGSVSATMADWMGGQAICSTFTAEQHEARKGWTGVSVEIAVSYLGGAAVGEIIEIEGKADRVGSSLGFTSMGIWKVDENGKRGKVVALGKHTKYVRQRG